jgi:hypothetical protein
LEHPRREINKEATMNAKRTFYNILIISLFGVFFLSQGWASESGRTLALEPAKGHPNASGTAVIDSDHINIQARGLKPDSVYTAWFVNMKPKKHEAGAGTALYMFHTDHWGNGSYSAPLIESPFGKWAVLMVVLHPNGNPKDMKNMVGALKAQL